MGSSCGVCTACKHTETASNSSTETKHDQISKQTGDQGVRTTCKQTETASNTSTDDTPQTQTKHDQDVAISLCVWGFILIHVESTQQFQSNNVIPEAIKQLIVNFVGNGIHAAVPIQ
eukprot:186520_1